MTSARLFSPVATRVTQAIQSRASRPFVGMFVLNNRLDRAQIAAAHGRHAAAEVLGNEVIAE